MTPNTIKISLFLVFFFTALIVVISINLSPNDGVSLDSSIGGAADSHVGAVGDITKIPGALANPIFGSTMDTTGTIADMDTAAGGD